jgi:hypothetical protein
MAVSLKRIKVDENSNAFGEGTSVIGEGSLLVASNNDRILQDSITSGIGILIVNITETNSSGIFTVNLPDNIGNNLDAYLELDNNNDVTLKS